MADAAPILVGDIGGTNARFALAAPTSGRPVLIDPLSLPCRDYPDAVAAIEAYLGARGGRAQRPERAVIAVAGPIADGEVTFTNLAWRLSEAGLAKAGFHARLINDYAGLAHAAPVLDDDDLAPLGAPEGPRHAGAFAVLGPGTGFGAAIIAADRRTVITTEAGHIAFAPTDALQIEVLRVLLRETQRVTVEHLLSGAGIVRLHRALAAAEGRSGGETPRQVTAAARDGDPGALATLAFFWSILGAVAGDLALAYGARSGVLIAGGIPPTLLGLPGAERFRPAFEAKGGFADYVRAIPTSVIMHPFAALVGAARAASL